MIILLMGVSGSGKSTIGLELARRLGWEFIEGDDFHPVANRTKMAAGQPLTDEDRQPWLCTLRMHFERHIVRGTNAVAACSALKRSYRDLLMAGHESDFVLVHLSAPTQLLQSRLNSRTDHFMPPSLLESQLQTLQPPHSKDECPVAVLLNVDVSQSVNDCVEEILRCLPTR